jgi:uncharacterized protein
MKFNEYFQLKDMTLNITNGCNLKCVYCFEHDKDGRKMSVENAIAIVDKCYQNYLKNRSEDDNNFMVSFFGGEPFLNFEVMEEVMKYSREKGYSIDFGVTTNLTILTDHMIDIIEEYELGILVSIDGIKEIHDRNRCNSYDTVKANVKKLVDRGLKYLIEARITVMPKDVTNLLESVQSIFDMGIENIAPVCVTDTEWTDEDYNNLDENLRKLWSWVIDVYNEEDNRQNLSVKMIEDYLEKVLLVPLNEYETKVCSAGSLTSCSIGVNGDILPCHQRHSVKYGYNELVMGNIFEDSDIKEIEFNNGTIQGAFDCKECVAQAICKGGCPSENYTFNGDGNLMNKTQCMITMILVNVAIAFQNEIMTTKNMRSHRLNILAQNMEIMRILFDDVLSYEYNTKEFMTGLMYFYEKLADCQDVLLPSFRQSIDKVIEVLVNIIRLNLNDEEA